MHRINEELYQHWLALKDIRTLSQRLDIFNKFRKIYEELLFNEQLFLWFLNCILHSSCISMHHSIYPSICPSIEQPKVFLLETQLLTLTFGYFQDNLRQVLFSVGLSTLDPFRPLPQHHFPGVFHDFDFPACREGEDDEYGDDGDN